MICLEMMTIDEVDEPDIFFTEPDPDHQWDGFTSRFLEDFKPLRLLGKGAFGLVFEARKRIDQKDYAVKRIKLPSNEEARAKVMREVTVLAELNHRNIVRYFHAWREFPPPGWQEMQDATELAKLASSSDDDGYRGDILNSSSTDEMIDTSESPLPSFASIFGVPNQSPARLNNRSSSSADLTTPKNTLNRNCNRYLYIQMELCRKESLAEWLMPKSRKPTRDIHQMYREILEAVAHLHSKGLIHRDLKPSNIFFAMDGTIKVGDLGLVKDMMTHDDVQQNEETSSVVGQDQKSLSCKNHTDQIGTRLYMSPEQVASKPYNHKVDVYALAIILFELLVEFSTGAERARVILDLKTSFQFPPNFKSQYGNAMEQLLIDMLSANPNRRPEVKDILLRPCIRANLETTSRKAKITPIKTNQTVNALAKKKYYKLLVIGDQNTGKTSIIHRYVHGVFRDRYQVTIGAGINLKEIKWNGTDALTLEFVDIGGEERSRLMTSAFYRKAVGAFVVTDVTQPNGFEAATLWKKDLDTKLRMHDDSLVPSVLLINKCDGETENGNLPNKEVDTVKVDRYCRQHKFSGWFDTSAKNDINIEEAVQFLVGKVLASETNETQVTSHDDSLNISSAPFNIRSCC
ncbi:eukaryotic translation initiation factor 2-alpha kinase 3-like [Daphnia carinata]|uniref:eukaryotic translation initiation factor 2-alpha kinase 3-like n=1 Tax=Daphnia carinata TaxID=120202 RepID=UPI00257F3CC0|nr:eukaryotic translation initiation factor 2-alpha kinase 3-like [Daphnia carinata]